ncbi:hypothetical protein [Acetobacter estunensis]|uniref:hypothetical protein n=1 Tax=Acetobacter estunensis TaxID=104097 RepID=UPI001C2DBC82|nr:hypothetical protein [Acetobacter estunensis]MBV1837281.1 hypothetical protein [Acetobacter estunensis]
MRTVSQMDINNIKSLFYSNDDEARFFHKISDRRSQELIFAFVGPVSSGVSTCAEVLSDIIQSDYGYEKCIYIKPSDIIKKEAHRVGEVAPRGEISQDVYITKMQDIGNKLREEFGGEYLIEKAIEEISCNRVSRGGVKTVNEKPVSVPKRLFYIIDSIKHIDEYNALRDVYGDSLILFGVFAPDEIRRDRLKNKGVEDYVITKILKRDDQEPISFGQKTRKVFVEADFFSL